MYNKKTTRFLNKKNTTDLTLEDARQETGAPTQQLIISKTI